MVRRVLVIGTLDTKGVEVGFPKKQIKRRGHRTVVMNIGILIEVVEMDAHINEPLYAETAVALLEEMIGRR